ncbi:chemotaxis signal transduction protein [Massilia sp. UYP11]|uniref:chemotaxis protein CheW n=1 Tax=Massilia sp. UYP11 TaxID=1756385 RepID=UPI003D21B0F4
MTKIFSPVSLLRLSAFGRAIAIEKSKIKEILKIENNHLVIPCNRGLLMTYRNQIIPVVDCRAIASNESFEGATAIVATVLTRNFVLLVDECGDKLQFSYSENQNTFELKYHAFAWMKQCVWRDGVRIFVVDLDLMMGPIIKEHLLK